MFLLIGNINMNVTLLHCTVTQSKHLWIETEFKIKLYKSGKLPCCRMLLGVAGPWKRMLQSSQCKVFVLILIPEDVWNSAVAELAKSWWVRFSTQRRRSVRFCGWVSKLRSSVSDGVLPCLNSLSTVLGWLWLRTKTCTCCSVHQHQSSLNWLTAPPKLNWPEQYPESLTELMINSD